jgi:hypothetical protein
MKTPSRRVSYNKNTLPEAYPHLHEAFSELLNANKMKLNSLRIAYDGRLQYGKERKITLGLILETLVDYGFDVDITVKKKRK